MRLGLILMNVSGDRNVREISVLAFTPGASALDCSARLSLWRSPAPGVSLMLPQMLVAVLLMAGIHATFMVVVREG